MKKLRSMLLLVLTTTAGIVGHSAVAAERPVTVTLLHYNDLHAHLVPHMDAVRENGAVVFKEKGGIARLATLVREMRKASPNTLLMNVGDTFHGGVESLYTVGNAIVAPVNALGIDVGVPGNWDFAYGPYVFRSRFAETPASRMMESMAPAVERIERPRYPNLAANLTDKETGELILPATLIKEVGGVKVGFIGLTSDIVPQMYRPLASGMRFTEGESRYRRLIDTYSKQLREAGSEVVVVLSELGIQKDYALAQVIRRGSVDVFFSAHTHEVIERPLESASGALVVEAGNDGYLGRMDITVGNSGVQARNWTLLSIDATVKEDPEMKALVERVRAPFLASDVHMVDPLPSSYQVLDRPIDAVIGHSALALNRRQALESTFNDLFTDLLRSKTGTEVALAPGFRFDAVIPGAGYLHEDASFATGAITVEDVYRFLPVAFTVATAEVSGQRLREIMEEVLTHVYSTDAFRQGGGWFDGFSGLNARLTLTNPDGQRVQELADEQWRPIGDDRVLTVAGCKRPLEPENVLCSYSGFDNVVPVVNPSTGLPWTAIDLLAEALRNGVTADAQRQNLVDLSGLPTWPESEFIQPLTGAQ